jgi:hypothetical protein
MAFGDLKGTLTGSATSVGTSIAATGSVSVAVGDLVFAMIAEQAAISSTVCNDSIGGAAYTAISAGLDAGSTVTGRAFYKRMTSAATLTSVTFTTNGGANNAVALAAVIEGPFDASPLDTNPTGITNDNTTPYTCPSTGTLVQVQEVVLNFVVHTGNVTLTATSPNTKSVQLNTATILTAAIGRQVVSATTAVAPAWTSSATPTESAYNTVSFKQDLLQTLSPGAISDGDTLSAPALSALGVPIAYVVAPERPDTVTSFRELR